MDIPISDARIAELAREYYQQLRVRKLQKEQALTHAGTVEHTKMDGRMWYSVRWEKHLAPSELKPGTKIYVRR
jgi:hypothetical protein